MAVSLRQEMRSEHYCFGLRHRLVPTGDFVLSIGPLDLTFNRWVLENIAVDLRQCIAYARNNQQTSEDHTTCAWVFNRDCDLKTTVEKLHSDKAMKTVVSVCKFKTYYLMVDLDERSLVGKMAYIETMNETGFMWLAGEIDKLLAATN